LVLQLFQKSTSFKEKKIYLQIYFAPEVEEVNVMRSTKFQFTAGTLVWAVAISAVLALSGCETTGSSGIVSSQSTQPESLATTPTSPTTPTIPTIPGPKRTVTVGKFDAIGAFTARYGDWDIGGGLSAMLTTALVDSGKFIVVERANLSQILTEQELSGSGVALGGPKLGQLSGVQMLIYGSVTEFGVEDEGGGFGIGIAGSGFLSSALGIRGSSGSVAMDIRLVDTTTGQVVESHTVKEPIKSTGVDVSFGYEGLSMGGDKFWKTPLGEASRRAINRVVHVVALRAAQTPWTGRVVDFDGQEMFINAGTGSGLQTGDQFMIERVAKKLTDPETGALLSVRKVEIGSLQLTGVEDKVAFGTYTPIAETKPQRGDLVLMMAR
jgi:curli biogenesis system outer membrane secretion channel CsgG